MDAVNRIQMAMREYFAAEKAESLLFIAVGVAALVASVFICRAAAQYRGMIIPLALIALIQVSVGSAVYFRTDAQAGRLAGMLERSPKEYAVEETARMETVMKNFAVYKIVEIALLAAGIALAFLFRHRPFLYSMGIGFIIQPAFMLVLDLFAERRGEEYLRAVRSLF